MQKTPSVYVILVTFNGVQWLEKCLSAIAQSSVPLKIIAIDNGSTDGTVAVLNQFSFAETVALNENLGFGKANNLGIRKALQKGADYVFLINQDVYIYPTTVEELLNQVQSKYGILSPVHFSNDGKTLDKNFSRYWNSSMSSALVDSVEFVNAASWFIAADVITKVGFFEPLFSHYGEDRNYTDRIHANGLEIGVVSNAKIIHDRAFTPNFNKVKTQSKFILLAAVLNINFSLAFGYLKALRFVFGLPKYYFKTYGFLNSAVLFLFLFKYYIVLLFRTPLFLSKRKSYKNEK